MNLSLYAFALVLQVLVVFGQYSFHFDPEEFEADSDDTVLPDRIHTLIRRLNASENINVEMYAIAAQCTFNMKPFCGETFHQLRSHMRKNYVIRKTTHNSTHSPEKLMLETLQCLETNVESLQEECARIILNPWDAMINMQIPDEEDSPNEANAPRSFGYTLLLSCAGIALLIGVAIGGKKIYDERLRRKLVTARFVPNSLREMMQSDEEKVHLVVK